MPDVAVGVPRENVGAKVDAGAVDVLLGFLDGTGDLGSGSFTLTQGGNAEPGDLFGAAITAGDLNNDGFVDLAVGAPGEDVGGIVDAGAVNLFLTTPDGSLSTTPTRTLTQGGNAEPGDRFGATLAAGNLSFDSIEDLAVGAPGENVGAVADAGAVNVFYGGAGGLPTTPSQTLTQGGNAEPGDLFGRAVDAGRFGVESTFEELVVGAPGENVGSVVDAGAVNVFSSDVGGLRTPFSRTLTQSGLNGRGDRFGATLTASFQNNDGLEDLVAGIPGEDAGTRTDAGAVNAFKGSPTGLLSSGRLFTQFVNVESGDGFGAALGGLVLAI